METRSNNVLVGGVVLGLLVALAAFMVWLSGVSGGHMKEYDIFFKQSVEGLAKGSTVTFSGVPSGQIIEIELWKQNPEFKRVRIQLKDETPILQGTAATILGSFTGPSSVVLDGAVKGAPPITDAGPMGVPVIPTKQGGLGALLNSAPQLLERISTLTERLTELLGDKNQQSIAGILANVNRLSDSLADRGPEIAATLAQARIAVKQAGDAVEKIGNLAEATNGTLNGEGKPLIADLRKTVQAAQQSMESLNGAVNDARPGIQAFSKQTLPEVGQLVRDLRIMSESLSAVALKIDQGGAGSIVGSSKLPDYNGRGGSK
ncbi:MCE family protein [Sphingomonas paeninsulae]|jgi:phospholipid/cholesterol/gamma-HCH transport system substrate-binding protein|uniref:MCE family protein n=1 Tax=Sphingomonas paeninsulae TaxID=2319844 RepID=A0A494TK50_SPHPE|nr:MlaD family protein [Sphingomonas paeninsulae]AYJ86181.1 MCE family protein [Sphingomonas paeninsulae]